MNDFNIKLIFFDLGSVLVHVHIDEFFLAFSKLTGLPLEKVKQKSESLHHVVTGFNYGRINAVEFYNKICKGYDKLSFEEFTDIYTNIFTLNNEIAFIAKQLAKNVRLSIISNTDELHFGYIVKHFPVMNIFESPVTSFQAGSIKPENEIFLYALKQVNLVAKECLFIDDIRENVDSANKLGFHAIQYTNNDKLKFDLSLYGFNL